MIITLNRILRARNLRSSASPFSDAPRAGSARGAFLSLVLVTLTAQSVRSQQSTMPGMQTQHQHPQSAQQPHLLEFPRLGHAQSNANESQFTLDRALETARQDNPTLRQAEAGIRAARARAQQAALYPNPTVGYS
jgi:outer membrane protein TolC